jgi:hypothetical protein
MFMPRPRMIRMAVGDNNRFVGASGINMKTGRAHPVNDCQP